MREGEGLDSLELEEIEEILESLRRA